MTIQEVIKSRKPFKRKGELVYYYIYEGKVFRSHPYDDGTFVAKFSPEELEATDWEIKQ